MCQWTGYLLLWGKLILSVPCGAGVIDFMQVLDRLGLACPPLLLPYSRHRLSRLGLLQVMLMTCSVKKCFVSDPSMNTVALLLIFDPRRSIPSRTGSPARRQVLHDILV
ncbi:hypothetical protein F4679DRAFT_286502 [Xylaria curta]|nr:hypothetical protein F4679DRAFT_286502 [Xylaria curta]